MTSPHSTRATLNRRRFLRQTILLSGATWMVSPIARSMEGPGSPAQRWRAAIIGDTGHGDYGHGHDLIFRDRANIDVVAVADPDPAGRTAAVKRTGARAEYSDYRQMLEKEKPHLVSIAPRWTDQHYSMASAALSAGAHIFIEKPFTQTLAEADELLALAASKGLKIAVAHQLRLAPAILELKQKMGQGLLGELIEIRAHGKQDTRAGGEDMLVLGTHLFDLIRYFAGDPRQCSASVYQSGRPITLKDKKSATENIGPIAGDEVRAEFRFDQGVTAQFTSHAKLREALGPWGLELIGTKMRARILANVVPTVFFLRSGAWQDKGKKDEWIPATGEGSTGASEESGFAANKRVVDDWLAAIEKNRQPVCSGMAATKALEMVMAVYHAALADRTVTFPLRDRDHPLKQERGG